ncbi:calcium-activated chloride channel regulator 1-like [Lingula anatina]|uniref:Calcium-activated chloride channel regulator 1-like n=1 Tax=Lingula anatina TaxID=7574 RepID=A0A1S3KA22_LINAN|nr:calcium-activated chloride channel regulator 1-like [Lingula anatina]|eukprot:XP_013419478.1 calcium-activated chloride channel regulator 1-like [Lingula anatina]
MKLFTQLVLNDLAITSSANSIQDDITYKPVEPFQRSDSGGLFTVKNLPTSTSGSEPPDLYPPGRIYDLVLVAVNTEDKTVTLSWTATGDDLDQGNASSYIIRYSTSVSQLRLNFSNTYILLDKDLIQGKLDSPLPAGAKETFLVQFNQTVKSNITYFIALLALDDKNQTGQLSNIVSVSFVYSYPLPPAAPVTSTEATTEAITTTTVYTTQESTTNEPTTHGRTTEPTSQEITTTESTTQASTTFEPTTLEITTTEPTTQEATTTEPKSNIVSVSFVYSNPFPSPDIATT